ANPWETNAPFRGRRQGSRRADQQCRCPLAAFQVGAEAGRLYSGVPLDCGRLRRARAYEDRERRAQLLTLSRFTTTTGENRSLKQYAAALKANQTGIYYLVGDSVERLKVDEN